MYPVALELADLTDLLSITFYCDPPSILIIFNKN